ncbi:MAG: hypothetical protein ACI9K3_001090 [Halovenus sp.]|jgi:hypothetical protein
MGTDETTTESDRFARVRGRLSAPELGGVTPSGVRERLSLPGIGGGQEAQLRDRLPTPGFGESAMVGERLPGFDVRERVPRPAIRSRLTAPTVDLRLPDTPVRNRLPDGTLRERLSVGDTVGGRPSVSLPDREALGPRRSVERRLADSQTTTPEYFVGVVPESHGTVRAALAESGLGRSYVTYPKMLEDETSDIQREAASIWVYRSWPLAHFQLHVPLFEAPDEEAVYVFSHHEYNWLRHPVEHLDAEYLNPEFERDRVVELLESAGLTVRTGGEPIPGAPTQEGEAA